MSQNLTGNKNFTKLGLGTSRIASLGDNLSQKDATALIRAALENNVRVIDTADTYGSGDSERSIAKAIAGRRDEFFIMTKAGFPHMHLPGFLSPLNQIGKKLIQKISPAKNFSKNYLVKSASKSLVRLQTSYVDAFLLHEPEYGEIVSGECWQALKQIKESRKAKYTGVSTNDVKVLEAGLASGTIELVQTSVSFMPGKKHAVPEFCRQHGIPFIANQILSTSGTLKSQTDFIDVLKKYDKNEQDIVQLLIEYVAYVQNADCLLIGTKNINHLKNNVQALVNPMPGLADLFKELENL